MKRLFLSVAVLILLAPNLYAVSKEAHVPTRVVAISATPVLNTPEFARFFSGAVELDPCRGVRPVEFVALAGTLFTVRERLDKDGVAVLRVTTKDYPYSRKTGLFIDARFVEPAGEPARERERHLPPEAEIRKRLRAALGKPYVWGGNVKDGLPLLRRYYPDGDPLAGVDCSGLLYEATDGFTPRNTSALTSFGEGVPVAGLSAEEIAHRLKPLDLLVYKGHVMVVLDEESIIQSVMACSGGKNGVKVSPLRDTVANLMKTRAPLDAWPRGNAKGFVVRRWLKP